MKTQPPEVKGNPRIVWGSINGDGSIANPGSNDWSVTRTQAGSYYIYPSPAFKSIPGLSVTGFTWNVVVLGGVTTQVRQQYFQVTGWTGATQTDTAFLFIAVGRS